MDATRTDRIVYHALKRIGSREALQTYGIHKLLFRLREDHAELFGDALPFYWYEHGPICEPATDAIEQLVGSGAFDVHPILGGLAYSIGQGASPGDLSREEADALDSTIKRFGKKPASQLRDEIYRETAPYAFMEPMKIQLWPLLEALANDLSSGRDYLSTRGRQAVTMAPGLLAKCEGRLPLDPFFDEFVEVFSIYRTAVDRLLGQATSMPAPEAAAKANLAFAETQRVWKVFAHGARVKHHDAYYDARTTQWELQYRREIRTLYQEVDRFYDNVAQDVTPPTWTTIDQAVLSAAFRSNDTYFVE